MFRFWPKIFFAGIFVLLLGAFPHTAVAQIIGQTSSNFWYSNQGQGQSFTATITGEVTQIQIRPQNSVAQDTLRIYNGFGSGVINAPGIPAYTQTVTSVATPNDAAPLQTYVLTTPFPIVSGNTYTFVFDDTIPRHSSTEAFSGGNYFFGYNNYYGNRDIAFQVTQQVSAPVAAVPTMSEWAMIFFGVMLAGWAAFYIQQRRMVDRTASA